MRRRREEEPVPYDELIREIESYAFTSSNEARSLEELEAIYDNPTSVYGKSFNNFIDKGRFIHICLTAQANNLTS